MGLLDKKPAKILKEALKVLGKKQLSLIIHGSSFPDLQTEDTAYGNYNSNGAKSLMEYISGVFTSIQLGPNGKLKSCDSSPYTSTIFSGNPLFIDLKQLTTKEWDNILSETTFNSIVEENPNKNTNKTAFSYAYRRHDDALNEAYPDKALTDMKDEELIRLVKSLPDFDDAGEPDETVLSAIWNRWVYVAYPED